MMVVTLVENSLINERWRACYLTKPFNDEELLSFSGLWSLIRPT